MIAKDAGTEGLTRGGGKLDQQPQSQPQLFPQPQLLPPQLFPFQPPQPFPQPQKRMRIRMIHRQLFPLFQHIVKNLPVMMETRRRAQSILCVRRPVVP